MLKLQGLIQEKSHRRFGEGQRTYNFYELQENFQVYNHMGSSEYFGWLSMMWSKKLLKAFFSQYVYILQ